VLVRNPIGAGDALAAGYVRAVLEGSDAFQATEYGIAVAAAQISA
jgi:sugar/nucleoside kinase (ribokinase family)